MKIFLIEELTRLFSKKEYQSVRSFQSNHKNRQFSIWKFYFCEKCNESKTVLVIKERLYGQSCTRIKMEGIVTKVQKKNTLL